LTVVKAVARQRLDELVLLVGEMREQRVRKDVHRPSESREVIRIGHEIDQLAVEILQDVMDDGVF